MRKNYLLFFVLIFIGEWMYRVVTGLDTYNDAPGYKHITIQPHIGRGLTTVSPSLQTYYGKASSGWKVEGNKIIRDFEIPADSNSFCTGFR